MSDVIRFPLTLRAPDRRARADTTSDVLIFPFSARRHLVVRHARAMRGLNRGQTEVYLTKALARLCDEIRALGIDCPDCEDNAISDFGLAVGRELYGPSFTLKEIAQ